MIAISKFRWLAEFRRRPVRALVSVGLLALTPKCGVCLLAYAGLGALIGLRGPEICGAAGPPRVSGIWPLTLLPVALGIFGWLMGPCLRRDAKRDSGCGRNIGA